MSSTIYDRFVQIHNKYYRQGNYLLDVPDRYMFGKAFEGVYNTNAGGYILESKQLVSILDKDITITIHKPDEKIERFEFEYYFGFGSHCYDFNPNKLLICCPQTPLFSLEEIEASIKNTTLEGILPILDSGVSSIRVVVL